ncbi:alpha/beta fold hydrolase [Streptomyces sp. AB3(2024)]|uniref:alpha/beta fold hydrolase n=1 Tax=Streptomyces sp. AB3(2024) TaxID=3317321 RepID=UPI0035A2FAD7
MPGYSVGGNVVLRVAARYPERVTALVLTATFVHAGNRLEPVADLWPGPAARGENDLPARLLVPLALRREPAEAVPGARHAEPPAGHLPFAERPAERAAVVTEFLSERRAG